MRISFHTLPHPALLFLLMLCACQSKQEKQNAAPPAEEPNEYQEVMEQLSDSIAQEDISNKCAIIYCNLSDLSDLLTSVKSPDALIRAKKAYLENIGTLTQDIPTLSSEEQRFVLKQKTDLETLYAQTCRAYEIPANGVAENLNNLIKRLDRITTKEELERFQDVRIGILSRLDDLYLCVEQNSNRIPEIKRLSQTLKSKYEAKKHEFGIN